MSVSFSLLSQENVTTVGFQFKPIISTKFINSGAAESTTDWIRAEFEAEGGYTMGMVIRRGFKYSALIPLLQRQVLCVDTTASTPSTLR